MPLYFTTALCVAGVQHILKPEAFIWRTLIIKLEESFCKIFSLMNIWKSVCQLDSSARLPASHGFDSKYPIPK